MQKLKVLVTGGAGYIGSTLVPMLLQRGHHVRVLDNLLFGGESMLHMATHPGLEILKRDIQDEATLVGAIDGMDVVIHLASIVGDPACAKQPELAEQVNWVASKVLFDRCERDSNVSRFIFASTCSNYGKMNNTDCVTEASPLTPVSLYARLKVKFEEYLLTTRTRSDFFPTSLRFATVYGFSPRMRFDLTVNEFTRELVLGRELVVYGEQFWRPYCHVRDIGRACLLVLEAEPEKISRQVFNVGSTQENYTKQMLVELISNHVQAPRVRYVRKEEDPRDYRVDFSKIESVLGFRTTWTVEDGIREVKTVLKSGIIENPFDRRYSNA